MKRFLLVLTMILSFAFLVGCDGFGNKKKEEITQEELALMVDKVDHTKVADEVISIESDIDVKLAVKVDPFEMDGISLNKVVEVIFDVKGEFNVYANLSSFEKLYVYGEVDLDIDSNIGDLLEDEDILAALGLDEYEYEDGFPGMNSPVMAILGMLNGKINVKVYLIGGDLFLNASYDFGGVNVTLKQKELDFLSEESFLDFKEGLLEALDISDILEIDDEEKPDSVVYKFFKVGNSGLIEINIGEEIFADYLDLFAISKAEDSPVNIINNKGFENTFSIQFSNKLESMSLKSNSDIEFEINYEPISVNVKLYTKVNVKANFKGKMPKKLPTAKDFDDYEEGINLF